MDESWKESKCATLEKWLNKLCYIHLQEFKDIKNDGDKERSDGKLGPGAASEYLGAIIGLSGARRCAHQGDDFTVDGFVWWGSKGIGDHPQEVRQPLLHFLCRSRRAFSLQREANRGSKWLRSRLRSGVWGREGWSIRGQSVLCRGTREMFTTVYPISGAGDGDRGSQGPHLPDGDTD